MGDEQRGGGSVGSRNGSGGVQVRTLPSEHTDPPTIHTNARRRRLSLSAAAAHVVGSAPAQTGIEAYSPPERRKHGHGHVRGVLLLSASSVSRPYLTVIAAASGGSGSVSSVGYPPLGEDRLSARTARLPLCHSEGVTCRGAIRVACSFPNC